MDIVCLDMEGVVVPEIWIAFSEASGIPELKRTTRDEPDYDKLMAAAIGALQSPTACTFPSPRASALKTDDSEANPPVTVMAGNTSPSFLSFLQIVTSLLSITAVGRHHSFIISHGL